MKNESQIANEVKEEKDDTPVAVKEETKDGASTYAGKLFGMIIYPEAMEKVGWEKSDLITFIQGFEPKKWYAILHDKDVWTTKEEKEYKEKWEKEHGGKPLLPEDVEQWEAHKAGRLKKPHYHVVMLFSRPRKIQPIRDRLSAEVGGTITGLNYWRPAIRYLTHMDSKKKEHYPPEAIFGYSNHYLDDCQPELDVQEMEMDIMSAILTGGGMNNYAVLMRWARVQGYQYVKFIRAHTSHFNNMCRGMAELNKDNDTKGKGLSVGTPRKQSAVAASFAAQALEGSPQAQPAQQADCQQQAQQQAQSVVARAQRLGAPILGGLQNAVKLAPQPEQGNVGGGTLQQAADGAGGWGTGAVSSAYAASMQEAQALTMRRSALAAAGQSTYTEPPRSRFDPSKPRTAAEAMGGSPFENREAVNTEDRADLLLLKHQFDELEKFAQYVTTDYNDYAKNLQSGNYPQRDLDGMRYICGKNAIKLQNKIIDLTCLIDKLALPGGQKKSLLMELQALETDYSAILIAARRGDFD